MQGLRSMPILQASDVDECASFYVNRLGFDLAGSWLDDDGVNSFSIVQMDHITLGIARGKDVSNSGDWSAYFYLSDINAFADHILSRGVKVERGPETSFYFCSEVELIDPAGNTVVFAQDLKPGEDGPGL